MERSDDGRTFNTVGTVSSKGNGRNSYRYEDNGPAAGQHYYRIKQVDRDGKFTYSSIVKAEGEEKRLFQLNGNVVTTTLSFSIQSPELQTRRLFISDAAGRVVQRAAAKAGLNNLPVSHLNSGVYFISYTTGRNEVQTERFVKQ